MTQAMSNENSSDGDDTTRTTVEVDRAVWRQLRSEAVADGQNISDKLEDVLIDYFDIETGTNE